MVNKNMAEEWAANIRHLVRKFLSDFEPQISLANITSCHAEMFVLKAKMSRDVRTTISFFETFPKEDRREFLWCHHDIALFKPQWV